MAIKDLNTNENIDRDKKAAEDWESHHTTGDRYPQDAEGIGEVGIKNAHASGDGSVGRNESSLPEPDKESKPDDSTY